MKVKVDTDYRSDIDKKFDSIYNKMVRDARLNPRQENIVAAYLYKIMQMRIHEIEGAVEMSWIIALIESEKFGTDQRRGAKRLLRAQAKAVDVRNEAYGHDCFDGGGFWKSYDGCGFERLQIRLGRHGCEYDAKLKGDEG